MTPPVRSYDFSQKNQVNQTWIVTLPHKSQTFLQTISHPPDKIFLKLRLKHLPKIALSFEVLSHASPPSMSWYLILPIWKSPSPAYIKSSEQVLFEHTTLLFIHSDLGTEEASLQKIGSATYFSPYRGECYLFSISLQYFPFAMSPLSQFLYVCIIL